MLTEESFLRNLPVVIEARQRLELEAIGFAISAFAYSYERLREEAVALSKLDQESKSKRDHTPIFANAWAAVDAVHLIRQLIGAVKPSASASILHAFVDETASATLLRNRMDHIHNNIRNLALRSGQPSPIFGALSFVVVDRDEHVGIENGKAVLKGFRGYALHAGRPARLTFPAMRGLAEGEQVDVPVGVIELHAFDLTMNLSAAHQSVQSVARYFEDNFAPRLLGKIRAHVAEGFDPEVEIKNTGISVLLEFEAGIVPNETSQQTEAEGPI
jgi:hypothetical protein